MDLIELLQEVPGISRNGLPPLRVEGIVADSRQLRPGSLFVAIQGTNDNGHLYLADAEQAGAVAALGQEPDPGLGIPYLRAEDSRLAYAYLAAAWHGYPARELVMIGITGTDGKTTTAALLFDILRRAEMAAGLISTVSANIGSDTVDTGLHVTTPDPMELQALLRNMVEAGLTHCVLEATSHGLSQHRVAACEFDVGVVTNVTHDHLEFHGSYEAYRAAKGLLISGLSESPTKPGAPEKAAVLNRDDGAYPYLNPLAKVRRITYGFDPDADVRGTALQSGPEGIRLIVNRDGQKTALKTSMVGGYNAANVLAAFATAVHGLEIDPSIVRDAVADFAGVPGRMERIDLGQNFLAMVDFAHTPSALKEALTAARTLTDGRVISVFGSAGLRDQAKRRMMAEISAELADRSIFTAEDPRTEPLGDILEQMAEGARDKGGDEGATFWRIPDRGEAIRHAIKLAQGGDLVIALGKGHEQSMCFGETEYPWDDRIALRAALAEHLEMPGPEMPVLPTSGDA
ncbi:MAG: UDP-N-acetylmuramoyl-L-alanyl-D-glutamate--2,6-diaminopimelate ligase [Chloroflexi bacterium]|nr:UDP-N-acetylmuramoyl-L-alanyl-D-glutamate--2,6-diaminopimelate ligase [Chloroflexota bacterium]MCI0876138.1 UDP-N-acetylmuramoyl-L-alanyl-D-glutamate--2,6-diaminopimelate ligase [Chloroflexota bacterium]